MSATPTGEAAAQVLATLVASAQPPDDEAGRGLTASLAQAARWGRLADLAGWARSCGVTPEVDVTVVHPETVADDVEVAVTQAVTVAAGLPLASVAVLRGDDLIGARALACVYLGWDPVRVTGWPRGAADRMVPSDADWIDQVASIRARVAPAAGLHRSTEPAQLLRTIGASEQAWILAFLLASAGRGVPVLLDGEAAICAAALARWSCPAAAGWWQAADRGEAPTMAPLLADLDLVPVLDLGADDPDATSALLAVGVVRRAAALVPSPGGS
ncbi:MAG: nicotinate-nucleotide--dimethylbenzimidazole phosphoribosyltransferase [Kineosporiaceae bacterium]